MRFTLFDYEIIIRKNFKLHYTPQQSSYKTDEEYVLKYPIEKRIHAMISDKGFITYIFRDFDIALVMYGEYAEQLLKDVMTSLMNIRNKLLLAGATAEQIKLFDNKVHSSFNSLCKVLENRKDFKILNEIKNFDIKNYHNNVKAT